MHLEMNIELEGSMFTVEEHVIYSVIETATQQEQTAKTSEQATTAAAFRGRAAAPASSASIPASSQSASSCNQTSTQVLVIPPQTYFTREKNSLAAFDILCFIDPPLYETRVRCNRSKLRPEEARCVNDMNRGLVAHLATRVAANLCLGDACGRFWMFHDSHFLRRHVRHGSLVPQ